MRALLLILLTSTPIVGDELYKDTKRHFQFRIPDGWFAIPQAELDAMLAGVRGTDKTDQDLQYICCLRRTGSNPGDLPSIVVQDIPRTIHYSSWDDFETGMSKDLNQPLVTLQKNEDGHLVKSLEVKTIYSDRPNNRVLMITSIGGQGMSEIRGLSFTHVGSERMIVLHCWEEENNFEAAVPIFERISDNFHYEDGYSFQPVLAANIVSSPSVSSVENLKPLVWLAFFLGAMAIYIRRRR